MNTFKVIVLCLLLANVASADSPYAATLPCSGPAISTKRMIDLVSENQGESSEYEATYAEVDERIAVGDDYGPLYQTGYFPFNFEVSIIPGGQLSLSFGTFMDYQSPQFDNLEHYTGCVEVSDRTTFDCSLADKKNGQFICKGQPSHTSSLPMGGRSDGASDLSQSSVWPFFNDFSVTVTDQCYKVTVKDTSVPGKEKWYVFYSRLLND